ncbi:MAG: thioredoxin-disulfide reductase [Bacteroidales bacterium]|jgi:thioredoxin reductase (NADPH)|nr:thioredoxin-disulfide reductase [Bacteroidales bacterium]
MAEKIKCLIIGSGPAGLTAAIYASRANLKPIVYEGTLPGGQLTMTSEIENFPGYPEGISGIEMMEDLKKQAKKFGTEIRYGAITDLDFSKYPFHLVVDNENRIEAESIIIATGASANYLGIESEKEFIGNGVSACAVCDGFFYRGKDVAVVGGGDTAAEDVLYLAGLCNQVYLIVRRDQLRASKIMQQKILQNDKIKIFWNNNVKKVLGNQDDGVTGILINNNKTNENNSLDINGLFLAIGHTPSTKLFQKYIEIDEENYIKTKPNSTQTNISGVFACGDVKDSVFQQAIVAAGSGCMAALEAEKFLLEKE